MSFIFDAINTGRRGKRAATAEATVRIISSASRLFSAEIGIFGISFARVRSIDEAQRSFAGVRVRERECVFKRLSTVWATSSLDLHHGVAIWNIRDSRIIHRLAIRYVHQTIDASRGTMKCSGFRGRMVSSESATRYY